MTKISATLCILLALFWEKTFACPTGCTCSEKEITCTNLNTLPDAGDLFANPNTVETVSITGSAAVTEIPENFFSDMPMLTNLSLTNNGLTSLNELSFRYLPVLSNIDISGNPIDCDGGENDWIKTWLAAVGTSDLIGSCSDGRDFDKYTDGIADVAPISLTFNSTSYTLEESETRSIVVSRDGDTSTPLNVRVMVELSKANAEDVIISDKQLTISAGESSTSFDVTIPDNTKDDPDGWGFNLKLVPERIIIRSSSASFTLIDNDPNATVPPVVRTTENTDTSVTDATEPMMSTTMPPPEGGGKAWIIIVILLVLAVAIVITVFIWKKKQDRKRTSASPGQGDYSAVQKDGDGKVYSATTEEIA